MTTTEPSAEALAREFLDEIFADGQEEPRDHPLLTLAFRDARDAAYRRGYERAREDAADVADNAWRHSPNPRQSEHAAIAYRIRALAPPQEKS